MEKIKVMVVGLPGEIASLVGEHIEKAKDMKLMPFTLAEEKGTLQVGQTEIWQIAPEWYESRLRELAPNIIVDFSSRKLVKRNANLYCGCEIPFIRAASIEEPDLLTEIVGGSDNSAVIVSFAPGDVADSGARMVLDAIRYLVENKGKGKVEVFPKLA